MTVRTPRLDPARAVSIIAAMIHRFGFWSALAALAAAVGYGVPQILQVLGLLPKPWDEIFIFAPSLVLAPAFVLALAAVHAAAPEARRVWSLAALSLAVVYATLVSIVYVTQLGVVIPQEWRGEPASPLLKCCPTGAFLTAVDLLGYTLMSLATLFAAGAFAAGPATRLLRGALVANGLLAPFLLAQLAWPWLIWVGALWLITFPLSMLLLAAHFRRG